MRTFKTGATRDADGGKLDYEAFLSPLVLQRYAEYLHSHRIAPDGVPRPGDNWQKGIPLTAYMKSLWRHFMNAWAMHREWKSEDEMEVALCAILFNTSGYLHEILKEQQKEEPCWKYDRKDDKWGHEYSILRKKEELSAHSIG